MPSLVFLLLLRITVSDALPIVFICYLLRITKDYTIHSLLFSFYLLYKYNVRVPSSFVVIRDQRINSRSL